uniref:Uncharacterized protein n=1 Tax=Leersia perrieri TaxID=77586 RepID=A0A0D9W9Z7_9ORYZ
MGLIEDVAQPIHGHPRRGAARPSSSDRSAAANGTARGGGGIAGAGAARRESKRRRLGGGRPDRVSEGGGGSGATSSGSRRHHGSTEARHARFPPARVDFAPKPPNFFDAAWLDPTPCGTGDQQCRGMAGGRRRESERRWRRRGRHGLTRLSTHCRLIDVSKCDGCQVLASLALEPSALGPAMHVQAYTSRLPCAMAYGANGRGDGGQCNA